MHPPTVITPGQPERTAGVKRKQVEHTSFSHFSSDGSTTSGDETTGTPNSEDPAVAAVAKCGVKASLPFSVLVVEDTDICKKSLLLASWSHLAIQHSLISFCSCPLSFTGARLLMMQLKKMKCSTQRAENGRIAFDLLKTSLPGTFDLVLMDLRMPVMDGMVATKLIRNELQMKDLPIIALTGEMSADIRSECEAIGFDGFYPKPLKGDHLQDLIDTYKEARFGFK